MAIDYGIIGKRMKKERVKKGLTQEDMADKLSVSVAFYSRIETGRSHVNLKRIVEISEILKVDPSCFLTGINEIEEIYLNKEFSEVLKKCTPKQQKFIYNVAKLVSETL